MTKIQKVIELKKKAKNIRNQQYYAANARNARSFGRLDQELQKIYREIDKLEKIQ